MDELNFRRKLFADPNDSTSEVVDACQKDPNKAKFKADLQQLDDKIASALNVEVPENLAERILLNQSITTKIKTQKKRRVHIAVAASIVAAVGLTIGVMQSPKHYDGLVEHAIAHMSAELDHIPNHGEATLSQLNDKLTYFGAELLEQVAKIKFVSFCTFEGTRSLHIVMDDQGRDVTVFVVPKKANLKYQNTAFLNGFSGTSTELNDASVVVVTDDSDSSYKWSQILTNSLKWQKA